MLPASRLAAILRSAALLGLLCTPAAAATPTLTITIDTKAHKVSDLEVGFPKGGPRDNAVIRIYEGAVRTGEVDITMRLSQKDNPTVRLTRPGTYTLAFSGFAVNCAPKLYLTLPDLPGASQMALFTAKGDITSSKISIKDLVCDNNAKKYFQFQSDGSIKVTAPAK